MKVEVFKEAQEAYARGDYKAALEGFIACTHDVAGLAPADLSKFYHLIGNCYVKSNDPRSAAEYYLKALTGSPEKRKPSLYVNLGTALLGTKDYENALEAFGRALDYPIYTTPYKAYAGIGAAQLKLGNMVEAGAAYREAALDPANPAPEKSLVNLGVCFMELGRPEDAVSVYETALDFDLDDRARAKAYANLGQAYMAQGRVPRAIKAFEQSIDIGGELPALALHDYDLARVLKERVDLRAPGILDTGYIPPVPLTEPLPEDGEGFDPFAPRTADPNAADMTVPITPEQAGADAAVAAAAAAEAGADAAAAVTAEDTLDPSQAQTIAMEPLPVAEEEAEEEDPDVILFEDMPFEDLNPSSAPEEVPVDDVPEDDDESAHDSGLDETPFTYNEQPGYEYGVAFDFGDKYGDPHEAGYSMEAAETNMPSPENTEFFDVSEQQINSDARKDKRKNRRARGCGLKIAIAFVFVCILIAGAAVAAYVLGYGYPLQETVTDEFFAAVQSDGDTSEYWASDVTPSMQRVQEAALQDITSYDIEAVRRDMSQSEVYVKCQLEQGGIIDYEVVLTRSGISWAIEFVQLYFPSEQ